MTRRARNTIAAFLAATALLAVAAPAFADPVSDCADNGSLDGSYSNAELRNALNNIQADLDEYSDCRAQISGAIKSGGSGPSASSSLNPAAGSSPAAVAAAKKKRAAKKAAAERKRKKKIAEIAAAAPDTATKGVALQAADTSTGMPTGLVLALIALGLLALAGGILTLGRRVPAVGEALRRVPLPRGRR
jgi:hypothetical protein